MKTAVIRTGGKQYVAHEGDRIKVEKIEGKEGKTVKFSDILLAATDKTTKVGTPTVAGASVEGEILTQGKHKKVVGVKMKAKKRNKKYFGHRQSYTELKITKISTK